MSEGAGGPGQRSVQVDASEELVLVVVGGIGLLVKMVLGCISLMKVS